MSIDLLKTKIGIITQRTKLFEPRNILPTSTWLALDRNSSTCDMPTSVCIFKIVYRITKPRVIMVTTIDSTRTPIGLHFGNYLDVGSSMSAGAARTLVRQNDRRDSGREEKAFREKPKFSPPGVNRFLSPLPNVLCVPARSRARAGRGPARRRPPVKPVSVVPRQSRRADMLKCSSPK